jgi:mRNA-degrading endonuclease RelE of RelBE toxin-antitoxin system
MWTVEYTKRFLKDLAALPIDIQERVEPIIFEELDPESLTFTDCKPKIGVPSEPQ